MDDARETIRRCRERLSEHYGDRLRKVLVFGSVARGDAQPDSDIDLLVVLDGSVDVVREARVLADLLYDVQLDSDRYISAKAASLDDYEAGRLQLYRNVQREGVAI
ncbi:MAG: nucleotidyltransferase domain-containing protein [Phycisphaerae bacterium]